MAVYQIQFCLFNTVSEEDMLASMITYLEEENKKLKKEKRRFILINIAE